MAQVIAANAGLTDSTQAPEISSMTGVHLTAIGWVVFLLALYGLNKTSTGHEVIYLCMVLIVLFLFIRNYTKILPILTTQGG